jgi:hypothetical protein
VPFGNVETAGTRLPQGPAQDQHRPVHMPALRSIGSMSRPERRLVDGRELVNRAVLAETSGLAEQSLKKLYGDRARNGHPEGIRIGRGLFFDKEAWTGRGVRG